LSAIEGYYPRAVVQAIQAQLKVVGFDVELLFLENAAFLAMIPQGRQQLFLWSYGPAGGDAHVFLYPHFHSSGGRNYTSYSDAEVDSLLDEASITLDPQERGQIYRELQERLIEAAVMSPIYLVEDTFAYTPKVTGFEPHPRQHLLFGQVDIVDP
jgi:peptide/nickel transport system substrate-binding protein